MKIIITVMVLLSSGLLISCHSVVTGRVTPLPDAQTIEAKTYVTHCGTCHAVPHPQRLSFQGWQAAMKVMEQRMSERGMPALSKTDKQTILGYLKTNSR